MGDASVELTLRYALAAAFGLAGALIYAAFRLTTALFGAEVTPTPRARRLAWFEFAQRLFAGTAFSVAFLEPVEIFAGYRAPLAAVCLTLGLLANPLWPALSRVAVDGLSKRLAAYIAGGKWRDVLGGVLQGAGAAIRKKDP